MLFILLFGVVSLFSDMTHEGASSIQGPTLRCWEPLRPPSVLSPDWGAHRLFHALCVRKAHGQDAPILAHDHPGYVLMCWPSRRWPLVGEHGWLWACALLVVQRMGKAIKKPAKDTIMSFAATQEGTGKSFGLQELLDQIGAFLGPVLLYLVMLFQTEGAPFRSTRLALPCWQSPSDHHCAAAGDQAQIPQSGAV